MSKLKYKATKAEFKIVGEKQISFKERVQDEY